ncbi:TIGR00282 family metallophosphoesterase [Zavarzinella formosa]|uniref:TIGR00282 family metallophosphoesterase n=1 Tax=Zavarzinella formosa TaxID=360055 RepID=UPI0003056C9B|nr:TIGR00282 family metallophosphoesterase [Zavarzinella formosa]
MRLLFIGDIVGTPGVNIVRKAVPVLRKIHALDVVIANAENASAGAGLYPNTYRQLSSAGINAYTMGDHIYKRVEIFSLFDAKEPIVKPANFPPEAPGPDHWIVDLPSGLRLAVISLLGRTFMRSVDCPYRAVDRVLAGLPADVRHIFVDIHAEATADKYLMAHHLRGRVSAVIGTHTHVPTADEQIMEGGTAFLCDVGMAGPYGGVLGRKPDRVLPTHLDFIPRPFDIATEDVRIGAVIVETDDQTGRAVSISRLMVRDSDLTTP